MLEKVKTSNFIKRFKIQTMNLNEGHRLFALYFIGIITGTFLLNMFGENYVNKIGIYGKYLASDDNILEYVGLDKGDFFTYCIRKYYVQIIIILLLNLSSKNKIINSVICFYKGFTMSILICVATISYGSGGIVLFLISIFPHYFLYVPMFIYTIYFGINIRQYIKNNSYISGICKGCVIESLFVVGTAFFEVYLNLPLLINVFT